MTEKFKILLNVLPSSPNKITSLLQETAWMPLSNHYVLYLGCISKWLKKNMTKWYSKIISSNYDCLISGIAKFSKQNTNVQLHFNFLKTSVHFQYKYALNISQAILIQKCYSLYLKFKYNYVSSFYLATLLYSLITISHRLNSVNLPSSLQMSLSRSMGFR